MRINHAGRNQFLACINCLPGINRIVAIDYFSYGIGVNQDTLMQYYNTLPGVKHAGIDDGQVIFLCRLTGPASAAAPSGRTVFSSSTFLAFVVVSVF
jgi:hypothetical protein